MSVPHFPCRHTVPVTGLLVVASPHSYRVSTEEEQPATKPYIEDKL